MTGLRYAVITPVRNEEQNLPRLKRCLTAQTQLPDAWVIVDNGSTDGTVSVAKAIAREWTWVLALEVPGTATPRRGGPVVRAFHAGLGQLSETADVVVKLDADVTFEEGYFERLMLEFQEDPSLGMASGVGHQFERGRWRVHNVTGGHVWGPARAYRRECLADVLPLEEAMGWDAIDEAKARLAGWSTRNVRELAFRHHRPLGLRDGKRRQQWLHQGHAAHFIGYRPSYVFIRALFRSRQERWALAMFWGYLSARVSRAPRCADGDASAYIRDQQRFRRLASRAIEVLGLGSPVGTPPR